MKRAAFLFVVLSAVLWTSCGSSSGNTTVSNIKDRALIDNTESGAVNILNIDTNPVQPYQTTVAQLTEPKQMLITSDRSFVLIYDDSAYSLTIFSSSQETTTGSFSINYHTDSIVMGSDNKYAYAAVPDNPEQSPAPAGAVQSFDLTTGLSAAQIPVPGARRVAISNDNNTLLVFADNSDSVYYINLASTTALTAVAIPGFNRPYAAYFSSDNSTAYVLNCGTECTGSAPASVQPLAVSTTKQTPGTPLPVGGATTGWLNGTTLYVAGNDLSKPAGSQGVLSTVDVTGMKVTSTVPIADGLHLQIASWNNMLWIGSWNCTTTNCLSIVTPGSSTAMISPTTGNVTSFCPVPAKGWMYVMQGGQLYQFDPNALTAPTVPYDILGQGWDIKLLDQPE